MIWTGLTKYREQGLLLLRVGVGFSFVLLHGLDKLQGGPSAWHALGQSMKPLGIIFAPSFWGFMAMLAEFLGGMCIILGLAFRPACLMLAITMAVAVSHHYYKGDSWQTASHALEMAALFLSLMFIGPGKFSVNKN